MHPNLRFALAVLAGLISGGLIIAGIEAIGHFFFPLPEEFTFDALCEYFKDAPLMTFVFPLLAWTIGALISGVIAKLIYRANNKPAFIAGLIQLVFVLINLIVIGCHPLWMEIAGALLPVPMAMLGSRLIASR